MEKYNKAGQATDDNIIPRMRFSCWVTKASDTHSGYLISNYCSSTSTMVT